MSKEITDDQVKAVVKMKNRGAPPVQVRDDFVDSDERSAYNTKTIMQMMDLFNLPAVKNEEEAIERTRSYFMDCANRGTRPTWEEYAMALGVHRQTLWRWATGQAKGPCSQDVIVRAKDFIAAFDARMVIENKMNPVTYIFRSKNFYDMKDTQDVVVTPNQFDTRSREQIIAEAEMLPEE